MILGKINLRKVDKTKFFEGKNNALYLDIVLLETEDDQYGNDFMIVQGLPEADRKAKQRGAILGNAKIFHSRKQESTAESKPAPASKPQDDDDQPPF